MVKITDDDTPKANILDKIYFDNFDSEKDFDSQVLSYRDPVKDILFNHDFIATEINKFGLSFDGCSNWSQIMKHFADQRSFTDSIAEKQISWIKFRESILTCPCPHLKT